MEIYSQTGKPKKIAFPTVSSKKTPKENKAL